MTTARAQRAAQARAAISAFLGQVPEPRLAPEAEGLQPPVRADLDAATAATAAAIADRTASLAEVERLAEAEAATYAACPAYPSLYDPEAEAEAEI